MVILCGSWSNCILEREDKRHASGATLAARGWIGQAAQLDFAVLPHCFPRLWFDDWIGMIAIVVEIEAVINVGIWLGHLTILMISLDENAAQTRVRN